MDTLIRLIQYLTAKRSSVIVRVAYFLGLILVSAWALLSGASSYAGSLWSPATAHVAVFLDYPAERLGMGGPTHIFAQLQDHRVSLIVMPGGVSNASYFLSSPYLPDSSGHSAPGLEAKDIDGDSDQDVVVRVGENQYLVYINGAYQTRLHLLPAQECLPLALATGWHLVCARDGPNGADNGGAMNGTSP